MNDWPGIGASRCCHCGLAPKKAWPRASQGAFSTFWPRAIGAAVGQTGDH